jgi:hypothetical protein
LSRNECKQTVLPRLLELAFGVKPMRRERQKVVPLARGEVLDIGTVTSLNLPFSTTAG